MVMKSNALVIATLAWTAGIVGCIDEQSARHEQEEGHVASAGLSPRRSQPISRTQADVERVKALANVPIFIGGEKVQEVRPPVQPAESPSAMVQPIQAKV